MSRLMNVRQIAEMFGVTKKTIYEWVKVGRISKPINKFGTPRWDHDDALKAFREYQPSQKSYNSSQSVTM